MPVHRVHQFISPFFAAGSSVPCAFHRSRDLDVNNPTRSPYSIPWGCTCGYSNIRQGVVKVVVKFGKCVFTKYTCMYKRYKIHTRTRSDLDLPREKTRRAQGRWPLPVFLSARGFGDLQEALQVGKKGRKEGMRKK